MADINQIIDPKVIEQLTKMNEQLVIAGQNMDKLIPLLNQMNQSAKNVSKTTGDNSAKQKEVNALTKEKESVNKRLLTTEAKINNLNDEQNRLLETQKNKLREDTKAIKDKELAESKEAGTLEKLAARNRLLATERRKLNLETKAGQQRLKEINSELDRNNKKIKESSDALGKQKINIGNYRSALDGLPGPLGRIKQMFTVLKTALLTNPITAIITLIAGAIALISKSLSKFQPVMDKFNIIMAQGKAVLDVVLERIGKFALAIGEIIKGNFKAGFNAIKESWSGIGEQTRDATKAAKEYQQTLQQLKAEEGQRAITIAKNSREIEVQLEIMRNVNKTNKERLAAADEIARLEKENLDIQQEAAKQQLIAKISAGDREAAEKLLNDALESGIALTEEQIGATITNREEQVEVNKEIANYINLQVASEKSMQRVNTQKNSLVKQLNAEAEAQRKINEQKRIDEEIRRKELEEMPTRTEALRSLNDEEIQLEIEKLEAKKQANADYTDSLIEDERRLTDAKAEAADAALEIAIASFYAIANLAKEDSKLKKAALTAATIAEKGQAIFRIRTATNVAAAQALALPLPPPFPQILSALYKGLGIAQVAEVISRPIPQFAKGTGYAPGGAAIVGEKGRELIQTPSGQVMLASNPALINLERGSKVLTNRQTEAYLNDGNIVGSLQRVEKAIKRMPQPIFKNGSKIAERRGNYWKRYIENKHRLN